MLSVGYLLQVQKGDSPRILDQQNKNKFLRVVNYQE